MKKFVFGLTLAIACLPIATRAGDTLATPITLTRGSGYHLLKTIPLPGDKGWDYCITDSVARRLYVTHGDRVMVLNLDTNKLIGTVGPFRGIHGVALAPELGRGYVSDGKAGTVDCFNLKTLAIIQAIPGRKDADSITYDGSTGRVFAFNGDDGSATVIDARSNSVLATLSLSGKPEFCAVDGRGRVFVNLVDKDEILTIDARSLKIVRRSPLTRGAHPAAMSIDAAGENLFSGCRNQQAVVLDTVTGKVKAVLPIGDHVDASVYDPGLDTAFFSCGDGTLWRIRKGADGSFTALNPIHTKKGSRTLAVDLKTHRLYLPSADFYPAPATTTARPRRRPELVSGSFAVLVFGNK